MSTTQEGPDPPDEPEAPPEGPSKRLAWATFVFTILAGGVAAGLFELTEPDVPLDVDSFAVFAPVFFAAQAIERLLQPLAAVLLPTRELKEDLKRAREAKLAASPAKRPTLADEEWRTARKLRKRRSDRELIFFMIATGTSCVLAGLFGLGILDAMGPAEDELTGFVAALDVAMTGIVIGAGTKPLHDLIERVQKAKENADATTKPTQMLPGTPGAPPANG
jgi:hypothetical protein